MKIDPRIKIIYLILVSVLAFIFGDTVTWGLFGLQILLWFACRVGIKESRFLKKSFSFVFFILFFYAFFSPEKNFTLFTFYRYDINVSPSGFREGLMMCVRFLTIMLASVIVRSKTTPEDFVSGLVGLKMSRNLALIFDSTLSLIEGDIQRKKEGNSAQANKQGKKLILKRLLKGDLSVVLEIVNDSVAEARERFSDSDLAVIFALTLVVVSVRFIKVVAGFPVAPGHKNLIIIPCFIVAATITKTRFAATQIGFISGIINFMSGFGKYGVFGILQFMVPGLTVDLLAGLARRSRSIFVFGFIGFVAGLARVSAEIALAILFRMPHEYYLLLTPLIISQCAFGVLSAPITKYLLRQMNQHSSVNS